MPTGTGSEIKLGGERKEEVKEFQYLRPVLCKHRIMEGEMRESSEGQTVIGSFGRIIKCMSVSMEVKKGLKNRIVLPTLTYGSETWT